nr:hypothetical protein [uncultured Dyadobacter sp.]
MVRISQIPDSEHNIAETTLYNIAFGDLKEVNEKVILDDSARSNNGDMRKVLATIVRIMEAFMARNRNTILSFSGYQNGQYIPAYANQRMRLYQKIIDSNMDSLRPRFQFGGIVNGYREAYVPAKPYCQIWVQFKL